MKCMCGHFDFCAVCAPGYVTTPEREVKVKDRLAKLEKVAEAVNVVLAGRYIPGHAATLWLIIDGPERDGLLKAAEELDGGGG